ncbi:MAG: NusG domain II-containing protein [Acholeplasmataceae bacterium]|nr:NusG domain II-containing protein [Acholeplasmataceae bacterium]
MSLKAKRDVLLIALLLIISGGLFLLTRYAIFNKDASIVDIYYRNQVVVSVDLVNKTYDFEDQENANGYPMISAVNTENEALLFIIVLGDYEMGGVRQEVEIKIDFNQKTSQIIREESPRNICSNMGVSANQPLICLPNRVRVQFDFIDDEVDVIAR